MEKKTVYFEWLLSVAVLPYQAHEPYNPKAVVAMEVCDEDFVDSRGATPALLHLYLRTLPCTGMRRRIHV